MIALLLQVIDISHQSHFLQEAAEGRILRIFIIILDLAHELVDILQTGLRLIGALQDQLSAVTGLLQNSLQKLTDLRMLLLGPEGLNQHCKRQHLGRATANARNLLRVQKGLIKAHIVGHGIFTHTA